MTNNADKLGGRGENGAAAGEATGLQADGLQVQEVQVNNRVLLAQYVDAAALAQERLLAYLSGVLGERGVQGQIRGWDAARGVIFVAPPGAEAGPQG